MDSRGEETRHGRGMRDRVFQWAGRKFNQISESDSEPSSSSITSHQNEPSRRGSSHGQHPILPQQSDHLHLLFKVRHRSSGVLAIVLLRCLHELKRNTTSP